ncbi:MAG: spore germination protein GerW family protein [Negativicutes bacterium]|jgi:sporulation protein YtfJ
MAEKSLGGLVQITLESLKNLISTENVVGNPVQTPDGTTIIPVSRISVGFGGGGGDASANDKSGAFGGGVGGGVSVKPIGFLVSNGDGNVRFISVSGNTVHGQLLDLLPTVIDKIQALLSKKDK